MMAYNISEEVLLERIINDPGWVLFYQRDRLKRLLPAMAEAYILVDRLKKQVERDSIEIKERVFLCAGCNVREPFEHRCHHHVGPNPIPCYCDDCEGKPCQCVECKEAP